MSAAGLLSRECRLAAWAGLAAIVLVTAAGLVPVGAGQGGACRLLQPSELESALGGKAAGFAPASLGPADACTGQVGTRRVLIRVAERHGDPGGAMERQGIEAARKQGIQVDVKREGDLTCSTMVPPAALARMGFNTTCSIFRGGRVVAVEVTAPTQKEMATMDAVRALVEKAVARL
jgi:hypothetical protein